MTAFLVNYFRRYVEYDFTADLEDQLDHVSAGERDWKDVLDRFWRDFSAAIGETADLRIGEVLDKINEVLEPHLFPDPGDGTDPRLCPNCHEGRLSMRTARSGGAFIGCSNYPECRYTRPFGPPGMEEEGATIGPDGKLLGEHEGDRITLRTGPVRPLRAARRGHGGAAQARRAPRSPKGWSVDDLDLERAVTLLSPAPSGGQPSRGRRARRGRDRPLRPLCPARQDLRQPARGRGGLHPSA